MSLAQWCVATGPGAQHRRAIAKLYSFLGRYMHQQVSDMERLTMRDLSLLADSTREILEDEKKQFDTLRSPD